MKRLILVVVFASIFWGLNAQLTVLKSGNVRIGSLYPLSKSSSASKIVGGNSYETDSLAVLNLLSTGYHGVGAYVTFGDGKNVLVGEFGDSKGTADTDVLYLHGEKGIMFNTGEGTIFSYTPPVNSTVSSNPFVFGRDLLATAYLKASDFRLKRDVENIDNIGNSLKEISPIRYKLIDGLSAERSKSTSYCSSINLPSSAYDRIHYGFIAQEVKEIFPDLVVEDENGYLSIDYMGFIPILVDAYKNLEAKVKEQSETIAELSKNKVQRISSRTVDNMSGMGVATLYQNKPNPFKETTTIQCVIPDESSEAFICIYDLQGSQVMRMDISERGNCSVMIDGLSLKPGIYIYALIIDGIELDSKRMILTD